MFMAAEHKKYRILRSVFETFREKRMGKLYFEILINLNQPKSLKHSDSTWLINLVKIDLHDKHVFKNFSKYLKVEITRMYLHFKF